MAELDPGKTLELLRSPGADSREVAAEVGAAREDVARAGRLAAAISRATAGEALSLPGPLAAAVARAAVEGGRADLLAALAAHPSREAAKEAKRGLHLLRSRGVAVPEPARPPAPAPPPAGPEAELPCYASTVDGQGERAVWSARNVPGRGVEVGQAVVSDTLGLLDLQVALLGRKEFRSFGRDIGDKGRAMGVAELGREEAKSLLAAARALNESSGRPLPAGADAWLSRLGPAREPPDPADGFPPLPEGQEAEALERSGGLHDLPMLRGWLADEEVLRGLAHRLDEVAVSPLYIDQRQRAEQAARAVADATEAWLDEPRRRRLSARLFAVARHLERLGHEASARAAAAAGRALVAGRPASRIPFARILVEKAFPPGATASAEAPSADDRSLIVAPR